MGSDLVQAALPLHNEQLLELLVQLHALGILPLPAVPVSVVEQVFVFLQVLYDLVNGDNDNLGLVVLLLLEPQLLQVPDYLILLFPLHRGHLWLNNSVLGGVLDDDIVVLEVL